MTLGVIPIWSGLLVPKINKMKPKKKKTKVNIFLFILFLFSLSLRLSFLSTRPIGLTPDEAAQGYSAYSILKTAKDEWGQTLPLNLRSFGDFKPPLQTYLMIPSVAVFGLNTFSIRLPNALLGSLASLALFFLAQTLFSFPVAIISSLLLATSPWHIPLSRGAFEANLTVFFFSVGFLFLLKSFKKNHSRLSPLLAALFLGLNLFSYHSAKLITPVFVFLFFLFFSPPKKSLSNLFPYLKKHFLFIFPFLFFLIFAYSSFFAGGQKRGLDIAVFNPTDSWQALKDQRWQALQTGLPDGLARLFHNKATYTISQFSKNYLSYLSPEFFFTQGPSEATYGMIPGRGVLWYWQLPLLLFGAFIAFKKKNHRSLFLLLLLLLAPLPASLSKGFRAANRVAIMMPWLSLFTAWSLFTLYQTIPIRLKKGALILFFLVFSLFFVFFLEDYFILGPSHQAQAMLYGRCQAIQQALEKSPTNGKIIVSRRLSEPQAYVLFCLSYPPQKAQASTPAWLSYQDQNLSFLDQLGQYQLDRFHFQGINLPEDLWDQATLIGTPEDFAAHPEIALETIYYPNGKPAVQIYFPDLVSVNKNE